MGYYRGMSRWPLSMMKPTGWFQIGWSNDFAIGGVVPKRYFGEELAIFRTETGGLRALDAYCAHMGGHLAYGGTVCGELVTCPFHGWEWNGDGQNVRIPYQNRPNRAVSIRSWPVIERNDIVYLWHDRNGGEPTWNPPDVFDALGADVAAATYHPSHPDGQIRFGARNLNPFLVLDNAADPAHFCTVHDSPSIPIVVSSEPDDHLFRVKLGFGTSWVTDPDTTTADALDILEVGVGLSFTALGSTTHPFVVIVLSTTPIDDETSEMFQTVWLQHADGDEQPGRLANRMHRATHQLPRDIEIWEHQRYVERPAWAANEVRGFTSLRRWASRFYAADDTATVR
jgi:3-ketosteroid 9alpha-monooxygenase subunit A